MCQTDTSGTNETMGAELGGEASYGRWLQRRDYCEKYQRIPAGLENVSVQRPFYPKPIDKALTCSPERP